jgi:hypothetical protein
LHHDLLVTLNFEVEKETDMCGEGYYATRRELSRIQSKIVLGDVRIRRGGSLAVWLFVIISTRRVV